jgi:formate hydrogenlyase transcriptional activator
MAPDHPSQSEAALLRQYRSLLEINNAVVSQLDLRELLRTTSAILRQHIHHDIAGISLYEETSGRFRVLALDNPPANWEEGYLLPLEGTPDGLAFQTRQVVWRERLDLTEFPATVVRQAYEAGVRSGCSVPLIARDRVIGVLAVGSRREASVTAADAEMLQLIANQIASAIANALNFERAQMAEQQAKHQSERLQLLLQVNNVIASALDLPSLFRAVSTCLRTIVQYDYAVMGLYDAQKQELRAYALDGGEGLDFIGEGMLVPVVGTAPGLAITTKQVVIIGPGDAPKFSAELVQRAFKQGLRSSCSVPLLHQNRVLGAMSINSRTEAAFTKDDGELLMQIAGQIAIAVENALAYREIESLKNKLTREKLYLEDEIRTEHNFEELIGASHAFNRILKQIETVAPTDAAVLIRGETGTGKELIARAIHNLSGRRERSLVKLNCAAIPTGLLESELFGHEKGAFTGAITQRIGRFELAHHGTLLLDEVGDIPVELQPKLLRVLQEQEFERLGSTRTQKVDVRLIAATNADLEQMVAEKKYRSDLYYRLNVFPVTIPPLRERVEDIPVLARFFTTKYARRMKKNIEAIPAEAIEALTAYHWPGNVRELEHFIERAVVLTQGSALEISQSELKPAPKAIAVSVSSSASSSGAVPLSTLEAAEREHILRALEETNWVIGGPQGAAARLGMKRTTLQSRMQKLGITR